MAFRAALVDRARLVERLHSGRRVEGRTVFGTGKGPWFRCRLELPASPEGDAPTGVKQVVTQPTLMYDLKDSEGNPVAVTNQKRVEVDSKQLGTSVWDVVADPQPLRRKRSLIGFQVAMRRVVVHEAEEVPA